ncbi:MAG: extensin family protein [Pseudomonadota bacterium]
MFPNHLLRQSANRPGKRPLPRRGGAGATLLRIAGYVVVLLIIGIGTLAVGPGIPERLNPLAPLDPTAAAGPFTAFKLSRATATPEMCFATLEQIPDFRYVRMLDREVSDQCHIREHTKVRGLWGSDLAPVSTRCSIALRLYMWERHSVQPAAEKYLNKNVAEVRHMSSYSCRRMRTETGEGDRMSAHATASAIDIDGMVLTDGTRLSLLRGWNSANQNEQLFWRSIRTGACTWFKTVLSPQFNRLHADHFHLAQGEFSACR